MYIDAGELYVAHDVNPTELSGAITRLNTILYNESNYPEERKPEIKVTINPVGYAPVVHLCSANDVYEKGIANLPNYGINVSSFIVSVKSITTSTEPAHGLTLCWSKSFDLNQQWWDYYSDKNLIANASVTVLGYTKSTLSDNIVLLRKGKSMDEYRLVASGSEILGHNKDRIIECDVEFLLPEKYNIPSVLDSPIYVGNGFNRHVSWDSPEYAIVIK